MSSVLFVAAALFGALFFVNRPDPRSDACLAAAHLFADSATHASTEGEEAGMALGAGFAKACSTEPSS